MLYPKQSEVTFEFYAKCDVCGKEIEEALHQDVVHAAVVLTEKYSWILLDDFETRYCSVACCDKEDITNIDKRIKEYNDGDERSTLN